MEGCGMKWGVLFHVGGWREMDIAVKCLDFEVVTLVKSVVRCRAYLILQRVF